VCCTTHDDRDQLDANNGIDVQALLAPDEAHRCQCAYGNLCRRAMTQEDLRCDWCRPLGDDGHNRKCGEMKSQYGLAPQRRLAAILGRAWQNITPPPPPTSIRYRTPPR
jgi:hypothetical protein